MSCATVYIALADVPIGSLAVIAGTQYTLKSRDAETAELEEVYFRKLAKLPVTTMALCAISIDGEIW